MSSLSLTKKKNIKFIHLYSSNLLLLHFILVIHNRHIPTESITEFQTPHTESLSAC